MTFDMYSQIPLTSFELNQDGVAQAFTARYKSTLRYDHDAGQWFIWKGDKWAADVTGAVFSMCRAMVREMSEAEKEGQRAAVCTSSFVGGVEKFIRTDQAHAIRQDTWDSDLTILGVPGGFVDLQSGEQHPSDPDLYITKHAAVAPSETADCPTWLRFLNEATGGDAGMVEFLQRWCGYGLTGLTSEHALIYVHGGGGNGKSVFLNTVAKIMGDYATTAAMDTFVSSRIDKHSTDLAGLRGARLVSASETEEGRAWAEARIKQMTGGDAISARFMRQDFFTFTPQFKLTIVGNHAPALTNVDDATKRRFNIVPFNHKPANPDRNLENKLKAEWPGILRWMINGAVAWHKSGLKRPQSLVAATNEYFSEQDVFGQWLGDNCQTAPGQASPWQAADSLYNNWKAYAHDAGEEPGTAKAFGDKLRKRGFRAARRTPVGGKQTRVWLGVMAPAQGEHNHG